MSNKAADRLAITLAQLNPTMGDIEGNAARAREARARAAADGADLIVFSELFICGYPPEDLVLKPALQAACRAAIEALARETADGGPAVLIGTPWVDDGKLYNACALLDGGRIAAIRFKVNLPNYGVFDETARVRARAGRGACDAEGRAHRRADLRGHLDRRIVGLREHRRVPGRDRRGNSHRPERLAILARQGRRAHECRRRARDREPACR